jgi:hypothetical protein
MSLLIRILDISHPPGCRRIRQRLGRAAFSDHAVSSLCEPRELARLRRDLSASGGLSESYEKSVDIRVFRGAKPVSRLSCGSQTCSSRRKGALRARRTWPVPSTCRE